MAVSASRVELVSTLTLIQLKQFSHQKVMKEQFLLQLTRKILQLRQQLANRILQNQACFAGCPESINFLFSL